MNILFVVPYTPNLIRTRPYNLIRALSQRGHAITLFTLYTNEQEKADLAQLGQELKHVVALPLSRWRSLWNSLGQLPGAEPLQSAYCWQPALAQQLTDLVAYAQNGRFSFDIIHVEHLRGVRYGLALRQALGTAVPLVWDSVDCISHLFRQASQQSSSLFGRVVTRLELPRTQAYEQQMAAQFDHLLLTSPADREALLNLLPADHATDHISVLPNGVDLDYFRPAAGSKRAPATIVISGKMSYHANITMVRHFVGQIMPHVWAQRPEVQLQIVGKDPDRQIQELASHSVITVTGTVPDIRPYLQQATVAVAPLTYGAGIQNKVLEAMACATPVITTPTVAAALTAVANRDFLIAQEPAGFAQKLLGLLDNPAQQRQLGQAGRRYVESHHNWQAIAVQLEAIYQQTISHRYTNQLSTA